MRFLKYVFFLLAFTGVQSSQAQSGKNIDVTHYSFSVELGDTTDVIRGRATISFRATDTLSVVGFDLSGLTNENKGMIADEVYGIKSSAGEQRLAFTHANDLVSIRLARTMQKNDTAIIGIVYHGVPADGLIISKNKFGHRTFFSDNWPDRAHNWIPCVDDPADKASVEFAVLAPAHYKTISNGIEISNNHFPEKILSHWKEDVPLPTKVMVIGVADFEVNQTGTVKDIPVSSWVFPENKAKGFTDYAPAAPILSFFIDYIGPYPYKKLANVQSKTIFGGMENASAIFYFENSVNGHQDQQTLMAHEIAHQWFGNMATEKSFAHLWLSEGFATYLAILYNEKTYGADKATAMRKEDREQVIAFLKKTDRPVVDSVSSYMDLLNANSYQKGGWVLHMLRRQLGDSVFRKCIRAYYAEYAGKNAETRDLERVVETVTKKNLAVFFNQWLYTPGIPHLDIKWKYTRSDKKIRVTVKQLQKNPFAFPLELLVHTSSADQLQTVQVSQATQTFVIPAKAKPLSFTADPAINLLFEGSLKEIK